jgi:mono/diheme cytochrome c family protein
MKRSNKSLIAFLLLPLTGCASSGATSTLVAPQSEAPPVEATTMTAATTASVTFFTDDQADRGREVFRSQCTECHASSEFSDSQFKFKWSRRHAGSLYQMIQTQMPETAPGSLTDEEAVDLVAYILRMNGFEPGVSELAADPEALDGISLSSIRNQ